MKDSFYNAFVSELEKIGAVGPGAKWLMKRKPKPRPAIPGGPQQFLRGQAARSGGGQGALRMGYDFRARD